jgi:pyruvyltransferase
MNYKSVAVKAKNMFSKYILRKRVDFGITYAKGRANIGDSMVPWLIKSVTNKDHPYSNPSENIGSHIFSIGSILQYANSESFVWGSGFISADSNFKSKPANISAVRGPLSRDIVVSRGVDCPRLYCDPGILTSHYLKLDVGNEGFIGFVPHYADKKYINNVDLINSPSSLLIDVETEDVEVFVAQLLRCEVVVSSSLHGIILSESFGIPAVWAKFSDDVCGGDFKFHDYYQSTGRKVEPLDFYRLNVSKLARASALSSGVVATMASDLLSVFPDEFK